MDELKPCPFCGEKMLVGECQGGYYFKLCERCKREARVRTYHDLAGCVPARFAVQCKTCGHMGPMAEEREKAIDLWNRPAQCVS